MVIMPARAGKTLASEPEEACHDDHTAADRRRAGASADNKITLRLSRLLKRPVADRSGEPIGRVADIIVRLRGTDYPLVTGLVVAVGGGRSSCPSSR